MGTTDVCYTEDAVQAFLDYLVDPMLLAKSSMRETPTLDQQTSVAKQMHAAVLLYNYFHRKQNPRLGYLNFESFCKLAAVLKPPLLAHLKLMQKSTLAESDDLEKQLSITEKMIMDACDISQGLDVLKDIPSSDGWPVSKITVLLVDSQQENCVLQFSSVTQGVWSAIEKDLHVLNELSNGSEGAVEVQHTAHVKKKIKPARKSLGDGTAEESRFQQLAFSAVKEVTDINKMDLVLLESHFIYSLSKEKTTARFYIIQCTRPIREEFTQVPLKDVLDSLRGPLVKRVSRDWTVTPVVEYFHMLPYAEILSHWLSRKAKSLPLSSNRLHEVNAAYFQEPERASSSSSSEQQYRSPANGGQALASSDNMTRDTNAQYQKQKYRIDDMLGTGNVYGNASFIVCLKNDKSKINQSVGQDELHKDKMTSLLQSDQTTPANSVKINGKGVEHMLRSSTKEFTSRSVAAGSKICSTNPSKTEILAKNRTLLTDSSNSQYVEKLQNTIASKDKILAHTALRFLLQKKEKLVYQQRLIEDEIAQCETRIQTIINGGEDDLEVKIDSIVEACNEVYLSGGGPAQTYKTVEEHILSQCNKRKRLSVATLTTRNPCQELDGVCLENDWVLPAYCVSPLDGGFQATITLKGTDFECSCVGNLETNPHDSRISAAVKMLSSLQSMARPGK